MALKESCPHAHAAYGRPVARAELAESIGELRDWAGFAKNNRNAPRPLPPHHDPSRT